MTAKAMVDYALEYAQRGFAVFPLKARGKTPITSTGFKAATTEEGQIVKWWNSTPNANIGIACGHYSGNLFVVDLDKHENGVDGEDSLRDWERKNGEIPETANARTGGGGVHYLYRYHDDRVVRNTTGLLPAVDIRGEGGYIVAAPSINEDGNQYVWGIGLDDIEIPYADETLYRLVGQGEKQPIKLASNKPTEEYTRFEWPDEKVGEGKRNHMMFRFMCSMQERGLSDDEIWEQTLEANEKHLVEGLPESELHRSYLSVIERYPKGFALEKDKKGNIKTTIGNFETILEKDPALAGKIKLSSLNHANIIIYGEGEDPVPWMTEKSAYKEVGNRDEAELMSYISKTYGIHSKEKFNIAMMTVPGRLRFDPFMDWLNGLPEWDGTERVKHLLHKYLGVEENRYTQEAIMLYMVAAIARTFHPGRKFDYCLIVVGEQGVGKSLFFRKLAVNDEWYCDNMFTLDGKEAMEILRGQKMIELAELSAFKSAKDIEHIKAFITSQADVFRTPYDHLTERRQRQCVFCGTTNDTHFLVDSTGNRRYMPVLSISENIEEHLSDADPEELREHILQCWAEAYHVYKSKYANPDVPLILSREAEAIGNRTRASFTEEDYRIGQIQDYLDHHQAEKVCVKMIWDEALNNSIAPTKKEANQIADILNNCIEGWKPDKRSRFTKYGIQRAWSCSDHLEATRFDDIPF